MRRSFWAWGWFMGVAFAAAGVSASAVEIQGVHFPEKVQVAGKALVLKGVGLRTATVLGIKVFVAALYVPTRESDPVATWNQGGVMHFLEVYLRTVSQSQVKILFKEIEEAKLKAVPEEKKGALAKEIQAYGQWLTGFQKGESLMVTQTETGVEVATTQAPEKFRGSREFSKLIFSLWLAPDADEGLKRGILGQEK